ncbi:MAG: hypothetical protein ACOYZ8_13315 [Chloroflexota bacterium]
MTALDVSLDSVTVAYNDTSVTLNAVPPQAVQYYRVKHDSQLEIYNYKSRTAHPDWSGVGFQTPEVAPLFVQPKQSSGTNRTRVDGEWETLIDNLNSNDEGKLRYLKADNTALFNTSGFPQMESLTMGGNVITLDEIQGAWGRVHTLDYSQPPQAETVNYFARPDLVHKFVVVGWKRTTKETYWVNPPKGDMYWPFVSSRSVWVQLERLEKFPDLPVVVIANTTVDIRKTPEIGDNLTGAQLPAGRSANVIEYHPAGSSVWGRIENFGWIILLWYPAYNSTPQYFTTWNMATLPPPAPVAAGG